MQTQNQKPDYEKIIEESFARLAAMRARKAAAKAAAEEAAKPKLTLTVEPATAERARARPESVRLSTIRQDDISVVERPEVVEAVVPLEVDGCTVRRAQITTWRRGEERPTVAVVDYQNGYRSGGVVSDYNPLDGLRRPEDE
jgi:hypothetical protein